jgi:hypothetical protein
MSLISSAVKNVTRFPLLEEMLSTRGEALKSLYSNDDVAQLFGVSVRAIQDWIARGLLIARDLPGKGRFMARDLEAFLTNSVKKPGE